MKTVSSVLINFGHSGTLPLAVDSLSLISSLLTEVIVIDNSGEVSNSISARVPSWSVLALECPGENIGFSRAASLAANRASGDCLLFLSPDAEILSFDASKIDQVFRNNVGLVGALTLNFQNQPSISWGEFPGWLRVCRKIVGAQVRTDRIRLARLTAGQVIEVPWALGAAVLIEREVFRSIGGFDEAYCSAGEDQDFGAKLRRLGLRSVVAPDWCVRHVPRNPVENRMQTLIAKNDRRFVSEYGSIGDRMLQAIIGGVRGSLSGRPAGRRCR